MALSATTRGRAAASTVKDRVRAAIEGHRDQFVRLAHEIHAHPQLAFAEQYAAARITEVLAESGFAVRTGVFGLPPAFVATIGTGALHHSAKFAARAGTNEASRAMLDGGVALAWTALDAATDPAPPRPPARVGRSSREHVEE